MTVSLTNELSLFAFKSTENSFE